MAAFSGKQQVGRDIVSGGTQTGGRSKMRALLLTSLRTSEMTDCGGVLKPCGWGDAQVPGQGGRWLWTRFEVGLGKRIWWLWEGQRLMGSEVLSSR